MAIPVGLLHCQYEEIEPGGRFMRRQVFSQRQGPRHEIGRGAAKCISTTLSNYGRTVLTL